MSTCWTTATHLFCAVITLLVQDTLRETETETRQFERQMEEERKSLQRAWQEMERLRHAHPSLKVVYHSLFETK